MRSVLVFALAALMMMSLAFADVGPSPPAPVVVVHLVKNGQPDTSISQIYYICDAISEPSDSPVGKNSVALPCVSGTCANDGEWFYKLNPCYDFPGGSLAYDVGGGALISAPVAVLSKGSYHEITFDTSVLTTETKTSDGFPCMPAVLLPAILGALLLKKE